MLTAALLSEMRDGVKVYYRPSSLSKYQVRNLGYYSEVEKDILSLLEQHQDRIIARSELGKVLSAERTALYRSLRKLYARGEIHVYNIYRVPKKRTDPQYENGFRYRCHNTPSDANISVQVYMRELESGEAAY